MGVENIFIGLFFNSQLFFTLGKSGNRIKISSKYIISFYENAYIVLNKILDL